jgi:acetyl-CoA carboxylase biotin carboxyl carrier protein
MTNEEIKELLQIFNESGVGELEVQRGENRVRIRRVGVSQEYAVEPSISSPAAAAPPTAPTQAPVPPKESEAESGDVLVRSPIVGTYYEAPSPGAPPFVRVGDSVEPGQALCVIESMKLMNEIEAEVAGTVAAKLIENGRPVEYGEALFAIRPR